MIGASSVHRCARRSVDQWKGGGGGERGVGEEEEREYMPDIYVWMRAEVR